MAAPWIQAHSTQPGVIIVDVRPAAAYQQGHIPGAVNIPTQLTYGQNTDKKRMGSMRTIQNLFGTAGIGRESNVVLYDDGQFVNASRVFWVLEVYGHRRVALLEGGYPEWVEKGYGISHDVMPVIPQKFIAAIQPEKLATRLQTRLAINDPGKVLIDARPPDEYSGKKSRARRFGHIPNAINVPWKQNVVTNDEAYMSKSLQDLEKVYAGLDKTHKIITYCNNGKHSSLSYFSLRRLGYDVAHYDDSWVEWGNSQDLPIENFSRR